MAGAMHIGVDFDNTIVCYDALFHELAAERSLIPRDLPQNKTAVRDHLRAIGKEDEWTALQGIAYGARMADARPFPGVLDFFEHLTDQGATASIISHRTQFPIVGEALDLHAAAREWLRKAGLIDLLRAEHVHFELTRKAKVDRLRQSTCRYFIDNLPEFLGEPDFPSDVRGFLFDPARMHVSDARWPVIGDWRELGPRPLDFLVSLEN